jgi:hypothetical protein
VYILRCLIDALLKKRLADGSQVGEILKDVCVAVAVYRRVCATSIALQPVVVLPRV